jgi:hypothetical protein
MGLFAAQVKARIERDAVILRGDLFGRLEERLAHYNELYEKYRDEYCLERYGKTYREWREEKAKQ